jgi:hypothetical protein
MLLTLRQQPYEAVRSGGAKREYSVWFWMGAAFAISLCLAIAVLALRGVNVESLRLGLRLTARWSFVPFWLAYTGSAIAGLFGRTFAPLAKRGREFGLAYAAALLVHLSLVLGLFILTSRPPLAGSGLIFFLTGAFFTYLLAMFSFGGLVKALGSKGWYGLRIVGVNYILYAFARDFLPGAIDASAHYGLGHLLSYVPFAAMTVVAPILVIAAAARRRLERWRQVRLAPVIN